MHPQKGGLASGARCGAEALGVEDDLGSEARPRGPPPDDDGDGEAGRCGAEGGNGEFLVNVLTEKNKKITEESEKGEDQCAQVLGQREEPDSRYGDPFCPPGPSST